jgi:hypothetical protein
VPDLDDFVTGYLTAALWTTDGNPGQGEWQEHDQWAIGNIAPEALAQAQAECAEFQEKAEALLAIADDAGYEERRAGHDFWLTRNGHGAGFWDRTELDIGGIGVDLTRIAQGFGESDLYQGDDGRLYFFPHTHNQGEAR